MQKYKQLFVLIHFKEFLNMNFKNTELYNVHIYDWVLLQNVVLSKPHSSICRWCV